MFNVAPHIGNLTKVCYMIKHIVEQLNSCFEEFKKDNIDLDEQMKWDLSKSKIREFCIQYSKHKKISQRSRYLKLQEDLDKADAGLAADPQNSELLRHRERVKMEMEIYAVQEAKGTHTRAQAKFIEEGEKNTRYFLSLEIAQSNVKIMDRIKKGDSQVTTNQQEIIKEQVRFHSDRYRKTVDFQEPSAQAFLDGTDIPQLSDEQKTSTEGALTEEELTRALKRMKNGSSPGLDGITAAFIKILLV